LNHSFPWLGSFRGCTVHALVAISPWSCYVPPHRAIASLSSTIFGVWPYSFWRIRWRLEREEWIGAGKNSSQRTRPIP
jgi:hypothetical protein